MKKGTKKKGFTLIELIIVIAILGIIAAIAVPKFGSIQKDAKVKADVATAKVIADAALTEIAKSNISAGTGVITLPSNRVATLPQNPKATDYLSFALQEAPKSQINGAYVFCVKVDANGDVKVYAGIDKDNAYELYPNLSGNYVSAGDTEDIDGTPKS